MKSRFLCLISLIILYHVTFSAQGQAVWKQYNGPFSGEVNSFALYGDTLFIGSHIGILKSHDDGKHWIQAVPEIPYVYSLAADDTSLLIGTTKLHRYATPARALVQLGQEVSGVIQYIHRMNGKVFVSTDYSIYQYDPESDSLLEKNNGIDDFENARMDSSSLAIRWTRDLESIDGVLFCNVLDKGLFKSTDEAENWEKVNVMNFTGYGFISIEAHHDSLFCLPNGSSGLFLSPDKGQTWSNIAYDLPAGGYRITVLDNQLFLATPKGVFRLPAGSTHWEKVDEDRSDGQLSWMMRERDILFTSDRGGLYRWDAAANEFFRSNTGINTSRVNDVEVFNHTLYSGTQSGLHFTTTGRDDWQEVPMFSNQFVMTVVKSESNLWVGTDKGLYTASETSGFRSVAGVPEVPVWDIEVTGNRIFAATNDGVYVSDNEGATWRNLPNGESTISQLYLLSANDSMLVAVNSQGLYKFLPDSEEWERIEFFTNDIFSLNLVGGVIYAGQGNLGIYRSADYGATWELTELPGLFMDMLKRGNNIYASTYNKIFYSADNGLSWDSFYETGIPNVRLNCIAAGDSTFYVGTYGKSIWYRSFLTQAEIQSEVYPIENDTIYNVNPTITLEEFQENVTVSYGASIEFETISQSGRATGDYSGVNRIKIIAEDGNNMKVLHVDGARGVVVTGVKEEENFRLEIYPVPALDKLFIRNAEGIVSWRIINALGEGLPQQTLREGYLDVSRLRKGIYFLVVEDSTGKFQTRRFLKN